MARRTPEEIVALVKEHEDQTRTRRARMDADYSMWRLEELPQNSGNPAPGSGLDSQFPVIGAGYKHYTSNEPRTFADKVTGIASGAKVLIRVKGSESSQPRGLRVEQNAKERFIIGLFHAADLRLAEMLQPSLQEQLAWFCAIRGWNASRALLRKRKDKSTFVDIQPFDPRNVYWGIDDQGLSWLCVVTERTKRDIKGIYNKDVGDGGTGDEDNGISVYDFYDQNHNMVTTAQTVLKAPTVHGSPRVPDWLGPVGSTPQIFGEGFSKDFGDSIYAADRNIYPMVNFAMSIWLELTGRARSPGYVITYADGSMTLSDDPYKMGSELTLPEGATIKPLEQIQTTRDAAALFGVISGEMQRGSLPQSAFGELQFQLSGFAINSLRQGIGTVIHPTVKAMEVAYTGIANLLVDQYTSGKFADMEVSGMDREGEFFTETITPQQVKKAGGRIVVEILPELPQDDPAKMNMAQMARTPGADGKPLLGDRTVREDVLNRQDPDADEAVVLEQMADASSPLAQAVRTLETAMDLERDDLIFAAQAQILVVMRDMLQKMGQQPQDQGMPPGAGPPPGAGMPPGVPGIPAGVAPSQAMGVPQSAPIPQQGPIVPTGAPRPGAREDNNSVTADQVLDA